MLRVTARVLKEGVYQYSKGESAELPDIAHLETVREYIPASEFTTDALTTLEGKDVTIPVPGKEHEWRTSDVAREDGLSVGAVAGRPFVTDDGSIQCDFIISDAETIRAIENRDLIEVSAGYTGELVADPGVWQDMPYDAIQTNLRFNHILLLPAGQGRCGPDVRIINNRGLSAMTTKPISVEVRIGNATKTYRFTNEEDKAEAERMSEDAKSAANVDYTASMNRVNELTEQIDTLTEERDAEKAVLAEVQAELERVLAPEAREELAAELTEQAQAEEAILEDEFANETEREEVTNAIKNSKTMQGRRAAVVRAVCRKNKIDASKWSVDRSDGAFYALAMNTHTKRANAAKQPPKVVMGGAMQKTKNSVSANPQERILKSMFGGSD